MKLFSKFVLALTGACWLAASPVSAQSPGSIDLSFGTTNTLNGYVQSIAVQPDGRVLLAGGFTFGQGQYLPPIVRLDENGLLDPTWKLASAYLVNRIVLQPDGKVIVIGSFQIIQNAFKPNLARLTSEGLLDPSFKSPPYTGVVKYMRSAVVRPDGKIIICGQFNGYFGHATTNVALLNSDGTVDTAFSAQINSTASSIVESVSLTADGNSVLIAAPSLYFGEAIPANQWSHVARLDVNTGAVDPSFKFNNAGISVGGSGSLVEALPDGRVLLGGVQGPGVSPYNGMLRLNSNGTLDPSFQAGSTIGFTTPAGAFNTFKRLASGKILAGGTFHTVQGQSVTNVVQLLPDGAIDTDFNIGDGFNNTVFAVDEGLGGRLYVGGFFTMAEGQQRPYIARLHGSGSLPGIFEQPGSQTVDEGAPASFQFGVIGDPTPVISWYRGATLVGTGKTLSFAAASLADVGGYHAVAGNSSGSVTSIVAQLTVQSTGPQIVVQPIDQEVSYWIFEPGGSLGSASGLFEVMAVGSRPFTYQWKKNGAPIADETNAVLRVRQDFVPELFRPAALDNYSVVVSNAKGSIESRQALYAETTLGHRERCFYSLQGYVAGCALPTDEDYPKFFQGLTIARQSTDHIIIGGGNLGNFSQPYLTRVTEFEEFADNVAGNHPNAPVHDLLVAPDDSFYAVGEFTKIGDTARHGVAKFSANFEFLPAFAPVLLPTNAVVRTVARQPDGRLLIGGTFTNVGGLPRLGVARLLTTGAVDPTFDPGIKNILGGHVIDVELQADGKVLVAGRGAFRTVQQPNGDYANQLVRLNANGSWDYSFDTLGGGAEAGPHFIEVRKVLVLPDQRLMLAGTFDRFGGRARTNLVRLLPDGSADTTFTASTTGTVNDLQLGPEGDLYIAGNFTVFNGPGYGMIVRLRPDDSLDEGFVPFGTQVKRITFLSGGDMIALSGKGSGHGWLALGGPCSGRNFSQISQFSATCSDYRPFISDGGLGRVKTLGTAPHGPLITVQPQGKLATTTGISHLLEVVATDWLGKLDRLTFQWRKNGTPILNATNSTHLINQVNFASAGTYSVQVTSPEGSVVSSNAVLRFLPANSTGGIVSKLINGGLKWEFNPAPGFSFDATNIADIKLQVSGDLIDWTTIAGGISIQNGNLVVADPLPIAPKRFFRLITGPDGWSPWATADPSSIVPVSNLSADLMNEVQSHITNFIGEPGSRGTDEQEWENVIIAPEARYLYDPMFQNGSQPAYIELRLIGNGVGGSLAERGYIIVSLTQGDFPIAEFATAGSPKTDLILREAATGVVKKFMRFSPVYIAGENEAGAKVAELGTLPLKIVGGIPANATPVSTMMDTESGRTTHGPLADVNFVQFLSYQEMKSDFGTNQLLQLNRNRRVLQASSLFKQRSLSRNPTLGLQAGQTVAVLGGEKYASASLLDDGEAPVASASIQLAGGIHLTGLTVGSQLLRAQKETGEVEHYTVLVVAPGAAAPQLNGPCPVVDEDAWYAGNWADNQPKYYQLKRSEWCPAVGCGPTALAMLFGWWDHQGVPSAFYRLKWGIGQLQVFQFDYNSLKNADAPMQISDQANQDLIRPVYNDLHDLADVICNPFGDTGGSPPGDMWEAFIQYLSRVTDAQFTPMDEFGEKLVGVSASADWVTPGLGMTDWEGGGTLVANGIKSGRPGIVGLGDTLFNAHYALAYGYKRIDTYEGCGSNKELVDRRRYFKCNMGWGDDHSEWHNAEDVWFGLTARLWQKQQPVFVPQTVSPALVELSQFSNLDLNKPAAAIDAVGNVVNLFTAPNHKNPPSYFDRALSGNQATSFVDQYNAPFAAGEFKSAPAVANSANGQKLHVFGRGTDKRYWRAYSSNGGVTWPVAWQQTGSPKLFKSAPAAACSSDGMIVHLAGIDTDGLLAHNRSTDGGVTWGEWSKLVLVDPVAPSVTTSADGLDVYLTYQLDGHIRVWTSRNGGSPWFTGQHKVVGSLSAEFTSSPSIATSLNGDIIHIVARGADNRYWRNISLNAGSTWSNWDPIGQGVFSSAPAVVVSGDGLRVHVFGRGITANPPPGQFADPAEPRIWRAYSADGGATWPVAWSKVTPLAP